MCGCHADPNHNPRACRCTCHNRVGLAAQPPEPPKSKRKIVQISTAAQMSGCNGGPNVIITALCDDNTLWQKGWPMNNDDGE